jgi:hypothetical protein
MRVKIDDAKCCLLCSCNVCSCFFVNLSISNFSFFNYKFHFFNKFTFLFSSFHLCIQIYDVMVRNAGWCMGRISFYVSLCSLCVDCDG